MAKHAVLEIRQFVLDMCFLKNITFHFYLILDWNSNSVKEYPVLIPAMDF